MRSQAANEGSDVFRRCERRSLTYIATSLVTNSKATTEVASDLGELLNGLVPSHEYIRELG
jgi:hypothetical protein